MIPRPPPPGASQVALTVWDGRLATVADFAARLLIVRLADGTAAASYEIDAPGTDAARWLSLLAAEGVTTLLCGAISRYLRQRLEGAGIAVAGGCSGPASEVLAGWLAGAIGPRPDDAAGCRRHRHRGGRRRPSPPPPPAIPQGSAMRIAISATGPDAGSLLEPRFGRSPHFLVGDAPDSLVHHANPTAVLAEHGAGIRTAEFIAGLGVGAVVTGAVGPKAMQVLRAAGIRTYVCEPVPVRVAMERLARGELQELPA